MEIYHVDFDSVINGVVAIGSITYSEAIQKLIPLINKTEFQRKLQDRRFYEKLERDIAKGCIMPPITIAYVDSTISKDATNRMIEDFFKINYDSSFVLDGIQRLNTLSRLVNSPEIDLNKKLYLNIIFSDSVDKLLYRMITLNNGQKPMTPRHQVEALMSNLLDLEPLGITFQTEKERGEKVIMNSFNKSDLVQSYLAYMANSPLIDNQKIIQEKMDELIVSKIITSEPIQTDSSFKMVIKALSKFQHSNLALKWLKQANNLVGFSVGMRYSSNVINSLSIEEFENAIITFEAAFSDFNPSKIKLGKMRRELSFDFFKNYSKLKDFDNLELREYFTEITADE